MVVVIVIAHPDLSEWFVEPARLTSDSDLGAFSVTASTGRLAMGAEDCCPSKSNIVVKDSAQTADGEEDGPADRSHGTHSDLEGVAVEFRTQDTDLVI